MPYLAPERLQSVARAADEAGLDELWLWEDCFLCSGIASAAAALGWTEHLTIGIGLLPVPLRNVALTAMEAATLHRLFPDWVRLGVGHGVQAWMGQVGVRVDSPLTLLQEYLDALRSLLGGAQVTMAGRYVSLDGVQLDWPPLSRAEILAGAVGPRSVAMAGIAADGLILTGGTTPDGVRAAVARAHESRKQSPSTGPFSVTVYLLAATGPDAPERLAREQRRWGLEPTTETGVCGDARQVALGAQQWIAAGADTVVFQPTRDDPDPEGFTRFVAGEVRPHVR